MFAASGKSVTAVDEYPVLGCIQVTCPDVCSVCPRGSGTTLRECACPQPASG